MADQPKLTSRISGFYRQSIPNRLEHLGMTGLLSEESRAHLSTGGGLTPAVADRMSENVVASFGLPLSVGLNFRINHRDVLVPMAVEEPSVVAAASNAARLVRISGGFLGEATASIMTAQVQFDGVPEPALAAEIVSGLRSAILEVGNGAIASMVARGGGCRDLEVRCLDVDEGVIVLHVYIDVGDAMGANMADAVAEEIAPFVHERIGGEIGLRILSNLPLRRMVKVEAKVSTEAVGGPELARGIAKASRFAELDPFRAVTHNKGIMNGIDAAAVALGQDWRSIEAGAHAYAAISGRYRPLAVWGTTEDGLLGTLELPLAAATVGGSTRAHPGVRAAFELVQTRNAGELAVIMASVGLASNLAALKALAGEGIQSGHMKLHRRKLEHVDRVRAEGTSHENGVCR